MKSIVNNKKNKKDLVNINTSEFWDNKNIIDKKILLKSHIYRDKLKIVLKNINKDANTLLDIGMGNGEIERRLQNKNINVYGIDISPRSVNLIKMKYKGTFKTGNIFKIPFKAQSMDTVLVLDVLEHIPEKQIHFAYFEIKRILKKLGSLIISVPLNENINDINNNRHIRRYIPSTIQTELISMGFQISKKYLLYAFNKYYYLKKIIAYIFPFIFRPNLIILVAQKK